MFTGLVEEIGTIEKIKKGGKSVNLTIKAHKIFDDLKIGDSVATNGVCLTVTSISNNTFTSDVMNESIIRSNLGDLKSGSYVNIERAMLLNGRFGGHIVSGHIDGIGSIFKIIKEDIAVLYSIKTSENIIRYIVEKGSITIDGISLTVTKVNKDNTFVVSVIPHTIEQTILCKKKIGDKVNLENDVIGKYIEKFVAHKNEKGITLDMINKYGF